MYVLVQADLSSVADTPESSVRFLALLAGPFYPILHLINERCGFLVQLATMYQFGLWYMLCCLPSYIALVLLWICVCTCLPVCGQWYLKCPKFTEILPNLCLVLLIQMPSELVRLLLQQFLQTLRHVTFFFGLCASVFLILVTCCSRWRLWHCSHVCCKIDHTDLHLQP